MSYAINWNNYSEIQQKKRQLLPGSHVKVKKVTVLQADQDLRAWVVRWSKYENEKQQLTHFGSKSVYFIIKDSVVIAEE